MYSFFFHNSSSWKLNTIMEGKGAQFGYRLWILILHQNIWLGIR